jgi:hypothetical protein
MVTRGGVTVKAFGVEVRRVAILRRFEPLQERREARIDRVGFVGGSVVGEQVFPDLSYVRRRARRRSAARPKRSAAMLA